MLLSKYLIVVSLLFFLECFLRKWYKKNGGDYEKDKIKHAFLSVIRGCMLVLFLYISIMTLYLEQKVSSDVPIQGTSIYVYPSEDDDKYNYFSSSFIEKYIGNPSEITEETYFDKVDLKVNLRKVNLLVYLKGVIIAPFKINYTDFYEVQVDYKENTGIYFIEYEADIKEDIISLGDMKLRKNRYSDFIESGDFVQATLIYDRDFVNEGVVEKYILVGGEMND